MMAHR